MAAGRKGWARDLHTRELTGASFPLQAPRAHTGVLVLDEAHAALPGGILNHVEGPIHYLDTGGIQAPSLRDFGSSDTLLAGISKLYASHSGLQSLDGLERLTSLRFLYLDHNALPEAELLRLSEVLAEGVRLEALDVQGNPGCSPAVEAALEASPLLSRAHFLNGRRLRRG